MLKIIKAKIYQGALQLDESIRNILGPYLSKEELKKIRIDSHSIREIMHEGDGVPYASLLKLDEYFRKNPDDIPKTIIGPIKEQISGLEKLFLEKNPHLETNLKRREK